jgi:uncharacterized protein YcbX
MNEQTTVAIDSLHIYPVKSCGGAALDEALIIETGFELDRAWMVVDAEGEFVSQRELPRMALITPIVKFSEVVLRAPGMLALVLPVDAAEQPVKVRVWDDVVNAYDMGNTAAQWFSDFLGIKGLRLVRFDPEHKRLSNFTWTGGAEARNTFSDGYPLLVASAASLADLNARLMQQGHAAVDMRRFRPNIVLSGLQEAFDEDFVDTLTFGSVTLKLVKPCARCPIPNVDPATGEPSPQVIDTLTRYRSNPRVNGAVTFGMNAIITQGEDQTLQRGQQGVASIKF